MSVLVLLEVSLKPENVNDFTKFMKKIQHKIFKTSNMKKYLDKLMKKKRILTLFGAFSQPS